MNPLKELGGQGQSIWLDYIRRNLIRSGELKRLVEEDGIRGGADLERGFGQGLAVAVDAGAADVGHGGDTDPESEPIRVNAVVARVGALLARAGVDVDLVDELRAEGRPVALQVGEQVVVVLPVLRHRAIDDARLLVEQRLEVSVVAKRPEDRFQSARELFATIAI